MKIFVANFTDIKILQSHIKTVVREHLASRSLHRIIRVSVIFLSAEKMKALNENYRAKNYTPDVLTFPDPLNEILICPQAAKEKGHSIDFLIKHGLDHLLGNHHG